MDSAALLARLRAQREVWVPLDGDGGARSVCVRRPLEADFPKFIRGITTDHVVEYACDWRGFSEATLLGPAIGSPEPLEFDPALWSEYVRDHAEEVKLVAMAMVNAVQAHLKKREESAGNSSPSSN